MPSSDTAWCCSTGAHARTDAGRWLHAAARDGARVALRTDSVPVFLSAVHAGVGLGVLPVGSEELDPELVQVWRAARDPAPSALARVPG